MSVWYADVQERGAGIVLVVLETTAHDGSTYATSLFVNAQSEELAKDAVWQHLEYQVALMSEA